MIEPTKEWLESELAHYSKSTTWNEQKRMYSLALRELYILRYYSFPDYCLQADFSPERAYYFYKSDIWDILAIASSDNRELNAFIINNLNTEDPSAKIAVALVARRIVCVENKKCA